MSAKGYFKRAFGPDRFVQWITVLVMIGGAGFAILQFQKTREAYLWTNVYNIERDYQNLFDKIADSKAFTNCFSPRADQNQPPDGPPQFCDDLDARKLFRSLLIFYRLLSQLGSNDALPNKYGTYRLKQFCPFIRTPTGLYHLKTETEGSLQRELAAAIKDVCGISLSDGGAPA